eukprot:NODE_51_length_31136_cov_0.357670.p15 type:complete len:246 gc:universal NODE_51_length_31136_cov_0.357670:24534-23797(-)
MLFTSVVAHFTLIGSREQAKYGMSNNERFWPIGGGSTLRDVKDCLQLPATKPTAVPSGPYTIHWEIGNGAHHVGMCKAFLIDTKTGSSELVGQEDDCVSTKQALTVDLSKHSCTSCVIKATVDADHLGENIIEYYDSCLDVTFDGSASAPADTATASTDITPTSDTSAPGPVSPPQSAPAAPPVSPPTTPSAPTNPPVIDPLSTPSPSVEPLYEVPGVAESTEAYETEVAHLKKRKHRRRHRYYF